MTLTKATFSQKGLLVGRLMCIYPRFQIFILHIVICNTWAIHNNPERFDEPGEFNPERFIGDSKSMADSVAQGDPILRDHFGFGAGTLTRAIVVSRG